MKSFIRWQLLREYQISGSTIDQNDVTSRRNREFSSLISTYVHEESENYGEKIWETWPAKLFVTKLVAGKIKLCKAFLTPSSIPAASIRYYSKFVYQRENNIAV